MDNFNEEHRQAIRMIGRVLFSYKRVSPSDYAQMEGEFKEGIAPYDRAELPSMQLFIGAQSALVKLRERDPDLGDFLLNLDAKVNLLLQKVAKEPSPFDELTMQQVSISGAGLGFMSKEEVALRELLEFHLVLLPNRYHVYCLGEVVNCEAAEDLGEGHKFRVSAQFTMIMEEDREQLIQYNFRLQTQALKNRRLEQDRQ